MEYTLVIERDVDGWYVGEIVELPGCHTQAKTKEELIRRIKEAIKAYTLDSDIEISSSFVAVEKIKA